MHRLGKKFPNARQEKGPWQYDALGLFTHREVSSIAN